VYHITFILSLMDGVLHFHVVVFVWFKGCDYDYKSGSRCIGKYCCV